MNTTTASKETLRMFNGNGQVMIKTMPKLVILNKSFNDTAIEHVYQNTGIQFKKEAWNYEAQPTDTNQIVRLLLTYNFKTQYHDNLSDKNTLFLKFCNNEGFKVDSVCFDCMNDNHIYLGDLKQGDKLAV